MIEKMGVIPEDVIQEVIRIVYSETGIVLSVSKRSLIEGRLQRRMRSSGFECASKYMRHIASSPDEKQLFINSMTTNETSFFRTPRVWEYFENDFLTGWYEQHRSQTLKVWSAASSSGEEAIGIAICCEEFRKKKSDFCYEVLGTDISTDVIAKASSGEFSGKTIEGLIATRPQIVERYFDRISSGYKAKEFIERNVRFTTHNLLRPLAGSLKFDIVFLRNVLIYFQPQDQEKVLRHVSDTLESKGCLIVGESESLSGLSVPFKYSCPLVYSKDDQ